MEISERSLTEFIEIQEYMLLARKENATETYAKLRDKYLLLKALLQTADVNLTSIDKMIQGSKACSHGKLA